MAIKRKPYFYDAQLKRYLAQIMAMFAGYQVRTGVQRDQRKHFIDVPVIHGDSDKVAGYILSGAENTMASLPVMSVYMTALEREEGARRAPQHVEKHAYTERAKDQNGNYVINQPGQRKIVETYVANPYKMTFALAVWASNNEQLYQIVEQLLVEFDPQVEIQLSNSPGDAAMLTTVFLGGINFEKAIPEGTNPDPVYVATLDFSLLVWLSPPAKVYSAKAIREIHVDIKELIDNVDFDALQDLDELIIRPTPEEIAANQNLEST